MEDIEKLIGRYRQLAGAAGHGFEESGRVLVTSHSTRIEGSTLSYGEALTLTGHRLTPGGRTLEASLMTLDHHDALDFVLREADIGTRISVPFIQEVAARAMAQTGEVYHNALGTVDASKGQFRNTSVRAGKTTFMNFQKVEGALGDLVRDLDGQMDVTTGTGARLLMSFRAHYRLVEIHPFLDGNGRTARLLMNFIQRYYGLPLGTVFSGDRGEYYGKAKSGSLYREGGIYQEVKSRGR